MPSTMKMSPLQARGLAVYTEYMKTLGTCKGDLAQERLMGSVLESDFRLTPEVATWILDNTTEPHSNHSDQHSTAAPARFAARIRVACRRRLARHEKETQERLAAINPNWGRF